MLSKPPTITYDDLRRLGTLAVTEEGEPWGDVRCRNELAMLLEEACAVEPQCVPENVVTMNSTVRLVNLDTGETRNATLVYPEDLEVFPDAISVLDPLGIALIGRAVGDVIRCSDEFGRWRVAEILYQPEQVGMWCL